MPQQLDVSRIEKHLLKRARTKPRIMTAIVHPCSRDALVGAIEAVREGLIEPVLVGPQSKMCPLCSPAAPQVWNHESALAH